MMVAVRSVALRWLGTAFDVKPAELWGTPSLFLALQKSSLVGLILGATLLMAKIEHCSLASYGLSSTHLIRYFTIGLLGGLAFFSLLIGLLAYGNYLQFDGWALHGFAILKYGLFWTLFFFLVGFSEEILFRGYIQHTLARGIGFWPAAICCSFAFGFAHLPNSGEDIAGIAVVVLSGIFFSLCLKLTGSLWWGIGFHTAFGWAESFLYGTANSGNPIAGHLLSSRPVGDPRFSGGTVGPEGSFICVGLVLILIVLTAVVAGLTRKSGRRIGLPPDVQGQVARTGEL